MDTRHPTLISKFGGHAMAAGLTIRIENLDFFSKELNKTVLEKADKNNFENILLTDGELSPELFTVQTAQLLRDHLPWGQGFPEPLFEGEFDVLNQQLIQDKHLKLFLKPSSNVNQSNSIDAIVFNYGKTVDTKKTNKIKIAYRLDINHYNDQQKLQLMIEYIET
jgi:single-stranded-DNA-specific exonuclease